MKLFVFGIEIASYMGFYDNGSVSKYNSTGWTFTTIHDPKYGDHPVSGNRDFGYVQAFGGLLLLQEYYTRFSFILQLTVMSKGNNKRETA